MRIRRSPKTSIVRTAALTCVALAAGALAAGPAAADSDPSVIDPSQRGNLIITKSAAGSGWGGAAGDGTQIADLHDMTAIPGVTMTLCWVEGYGSDSFIKNSVLTTPSDPGWWETAAKIVTAAKAVSTLDFFNNAAFNGDLATYLPGTSATAPSYGANRVKGSCRERITDANGVADFSNIPQGLYYVRESDFPPGVDPGQPFFVTIPMTNPTETGWMYSVYAYPKDSVTNTHKYVDDTAALSVDSVVKYTIRMAIPQSGTYRFDMMDPVPTTLKVDAGSVGVMVFDPPDMNTSVGDPLIAGTDYTVSVDSSTPPGSGLSIADGSNNTLKVSFTTAGLLKLSSIVNSTLHPLAEVKVTFNATVQPSMITKCVGADPSCTNVDKVTNQAYFYPTQLSLDNGKPSLTEAVTVHFGGVNVHKVDQAGALIPGGFTDGVANASAAQFQLFKSEDDAKAKQYPIKAVTVADGLNAYDADSNIAGNWKADTTFTTDATGSAALLGLSVKTCATGTCAAGTAATCGFTGSVANQQSMVYGSDLATAISNGTLKNPGTLYWGLEVKAPEGYELQPAPFPVCVTSFLDGDGVGTGRPGTSYDDFNVVNVPANAGFTLPLTGWNGMRTTIATFGFGFIALAVAYAVKQRRNTVKAA